MPVSYRDIWHEAVRRLAERYVREHRGVDYSKALSIVSERHEEIGTIMDQIEGSRRAQVIEARRALRGKTWAHVGSADAPNTSRGSDGTV